MLYAVPNIRCGWKLFGSVLGLLAVFALVCFGFSVYVRYNATNHPVIKKDMFVYRDTTVSLVDHLLPFYLSEITLVDKDNNLNMDIFFTDEACTNLEKVNRIKGTNLNKIPPITGMYLLPHSSLRFNICALTNSSYKNSSNPIKLEMYVLSTLNDTCVEHPSMMPSKSYLNASIPVCYESDPDHCTTPCHVVEYVVRDTAYYSIRFAVNYPELSPTMTYSFSGVFTKYLLEKPNRDLYHCEFSNELSVPLICTIPLNDSSYHLPWNINKEQCLLAVVHSNNENSDNISTIEVNTFLFSPSWLTISVTSICVSLVIFIVLCICEVCLCYFVCYKKDFLEKMCAVCHVCVNRD